MANYIPGVGGGTAGVATGVVTATTLPATGAHTSIIIAVSAFVALVVWGTLYAIGTKARNLNL